MISTKQILTIGMLAALAVIAASTVTFGAAFATADEDNRDQGNDQECEGTNCRNQQVNQENDEGDNTVEGDINFN
jgi:hypothetical protein